MVLVDLNYILMYCMIDSMIGVFFPNIPPHACSFSQLPRFNDV